MTGTCASSRKFAGGPDLELCASIIDTPGRKRELFFCDHVMYGIRRDKYVRQQTKPKTKRNNKPGYDIDSFGQSWGKEFTVTSSVSEAGVICFGNTLATIPLMLVCLARCNSPAQKRQTCLGGAHSIYICTENHRSLGFGGHQCVLDT